MLAQTAKLPKRTRADCDGNDNIVVNYNDAASMTARKALGWFKRALVALDA